MAPLSHQGTMSWNPKTMGFNTTLVWWFGLFNGRSPGSQNGGTLVPYQAIFSGDIPSKIGLIYGRYLQFRFLKWPLNYFIGYPHLGELHIYNHPAIDRVWDVHFRLLQDAYCKEHIHKAETIDVIFRWLKLPSFPHLMRINQSMVFLYSQYIVYNV